MINNRRLIYYGKLESYNSISIVKKLELEELTYVTIKLQLILKIFIFRYNIMESRIIMISMIQLTEQLYQL